MSVSLKCLLLLSNSTVYGRGYLDHAEAEIRGFLSAIRRVLFVPYALFDRDGYAETAQARFASLGLALESVHRAADARRAVEEAEAIFIGGGNTFRLLDHLYRYELLDPIRRKVASGTPYLGASAGSIVACPTIRTTNDMPIVQPPSFDALGLIGFQINGHYLDPDPHSTHMGETREVRLREFHEENDTPVVGLREGCLLQLENGSVTLQGPHPARIFRRGLPPLEVPPGSRLEEVLFASG